MSRNAYGVTNFRCKSFLLELVVAHLAAAGMSLADYPSAIESVFAWMVRTELAEIVAFDDYYDLSDIPSSGDPIRIIDPVNSSNNVCGTYTRQQRNALLEAATDALDAVTAARYGTSKGYAVENWQQLFGPTFRGD